MEILSVSLRNFKSHSDRHFTFQPGTNAICGENGAGKTSILEAIAWALFNHRGAYKNEDLIRNGSASAQVNVTFISSRDQRTYEVSRCTRTGYTIYDPQLGLKLDYSRLEEEVLPWLRQQFGVAPGTDLADLFANTIGVPQGMFTADFLRADRERKKTFDTILKVEEYRKIHDDLLPLSKYAEAVVKELDQEIARYDEDLKELEPLLQKRQEQQQEIERVQIELQQAQVRLNQLRVEQEQLSTQATQLQQLETQLTQLTAQIEAQTGIIERLQIVLQEAEQAVAICTANRESYQTVLQVEKTLAELEQQRGIEQQLRQQRQRQQEKLSDRQAQLATLIHQLEQLVAARIELEQLKPLVQHQIQIEQMQQRVSQQLQACFSCRQTTKSYEKRLAQIKTRLLQIDRDIVQIRALEATVQQIPALEQQQQRYQQQLSRIAAAAQFEVDLRQLVTEAQEQGDRHLAQVQQAEATLRDLQQTVPLWADVLELALTTLHRGTDWQNQLMTTLKEILNDLAEQTSAAKLDYQLQKIQAELQNARQCQAQLLTLDNLRLEQQRLQGEVKDLETSLTELMEQLATEPVLQQQHIQLENELATLNDPRGRTRLRQQELEQEPKLRSQLQEMQTSLKNDQQTIADLDNKLATFASLSNDIQSQQSLRDQHRAAYQEYLEHQKLANSRRERQKQFQAAIAQIEPLKQAVIEATDQRDQLRKTFDPARFQAVQSAYQEANAQQIAFSARLPDMVKYLKELDQQLAKLQTTQTKRTEAEAELVKQRKVERFVKFVRKAYKDAGPRITERYVQSISREADKLFRELLNRSNIGLMWTRDYEIIVQEGAHSRRFVNLSGGEQMCAALAIRLALLKILADLDIAFFDEPTTNMDRPRRQQLAEAIANIKTFRQLFVISHDDTFEKITETIIQVERELQ